jgi:hypothetical protein
LLKNIFHSQTRQLITATSRQKFYSQDAWSCVCKAWQQPSRGESNNNFNTKKKLKNEKIIFDLNETPTFFKT